MERDWFGGGVRSWECSIPPTRRPILGGKSLLSSAAVLLRARNLFPADADLGVGHDRDRWLARLLLGAAAPPHDAEQRVVADRFDVVVEVHAAPLQEQREQTLRRWPLVRLVLRRARVRGLQGMGEAQGRREARGVVEVGLGQGAGDQRELIADAEAPPAARRVDPGPVEVLELAVPLEQRPVVEHVRPVAHNPLEAVAAPFLVRADLAEAELHP
mmetsp:Transcript_935/g.1714  ORF Transcript_935/g.1714 Transcript_935/m.1714 type:complete len:215 (-) Transcript_935:198-842(-)